MRQSKTELKKVLGNLTKAYEQGFWAAIELTSSATEIEEIVLHKPTIEEKVEQEKPSVRRDWPKGRYPEDYYRHPTQKRYSLRDKLAAVKAVNDEYERQKEAGGKPTLQKVADKLEIPMSNYSRWKKEKREGTLKSSLKKKVGSARWHLDNLAKIKQERNKNNEHRHKETNY
jgi:hypothetical protein